MNRFIRNEQWRVPFKFCQECKKFRSYSSGRCCLHDDECREAVRLYRKYARREKEIDDGERKGGDVVTSRGSCSHDEKLFASGELAVIREMLNNFRVDGEQNDGE